MQAKTKHYQTLMIMKKILSILMATAALVCSACNSNDPLLNGDEIVANPTTPTDSTHILVAYFSWGGTTQRMAQQIATLTGADLFRIEPVTPYPTEYTPTTEVARTEKEADARPAIKDTVPGWEQYDIVFIGCPVWWWTTPMIICTFAESYDFAGKTVVPFCTYASTYRDETLARIAELTPAAQHLTGCGLTSGRVNESNVTEWLQRINIISSNNNENN